MVIFLDCLRYSPYTEEVSVRQTLIVCLTECMYFFKLKKAGRHIGSGFDKINVLHDIRSNFLFVGICIPSDMSNGS